VSTLPSVIWRCWLGGRKGIRPAKTEWWGTGVVICLEQGANNLYLVQLMPLPLPPHHLLPHTAPMCLLYIVEARVKGIMQYMFTDTIEHWTQWTVTFAASSVQFIDCEMYIAVLFIDTVYWCIIVLFFCIGCCPCSPDSDLVTCTHWLPGLACVPCPARPDAHPLSIKPLLTCPIAKGPNGMPQWIHFSGL